MAGRYDLTQAGVQMTLAAIAYTRPTTEIPWELERPDYATKGEWCLAWGPVNGTHGDNLVYMAQKKIK